MIYFFSEENNRGNHAGTKARNDVERILREYGAKPINGKHVLKLNTYGSESEIQSSIRNRLDFIPYMVEAYLCRNKTVVVQFPMLSFDIEEKYLRKIAQNNRLVFILHDVHGLRLGSDKQFQYELKLLNLADTVIVHNRFMGAALCEKGLQVKNILCVDCFDYLCNPVKKSVGTGVAFAGNLAKSEFLPKMVVANPDVSFQLYGNQVEGLQYQNVHYHGSFKPDEIPKVIEAGWGLVWDGDSLDSCNGLLGEYMKLNNPHKMSLYIAARIPIITWKKAAIAEFITKNKIGIVVDSVSDLKNIIDGIPQDEYQAMCANIRKLQRSVASGSFLRKQLRLIEGI